MWVKQAASVLLVLSMMSAVSVGAAPRTRDVGQGLDLVAEAVYPDGMHLAVTRIKGRDYAFSSSNYNSGPTGGQIRVFDVTDAANPQMVATVPCGGNQGFLQVSHDNKTLVVAEGGTTPGDGCLPPGTKGFYNIDISNPRTPRLIGQAVSEGGGHHIATHPTKPYVYVSHGVVAAIPTQDPPQYEVWSIKNPAKPKLVATALVTGYHGPHDITFSPNGNFAVASSITAIQVLDTSDPANPVEVEVLQCPGCSHNHEAHFTPDGKHVVVSDETTGGIASPCPMGALYFYEFEGEAAPHMNLIGQWQPAEVGTPAGAPTNAPLCTSHVFGISEDGTKIAASWHNGGVRMIDITDMAGVGVGAQGDGAKEIGWYVAEGADSWSAKFDRTGRFVFVNDANTGFQVYEVTPGL